MLTKFKIFHKKSYWLVPTDDRLLKSVEEATHSDYYIERAKGIDFGENKYIFFDVKKEFEWMPYHDEIPEPYYESQGYNYMGALNICDGELDAFKFNL